MLAAPDTHTSAQYAVRLAAKIRRHTELKLESVAARNHASMAAAAARSALAARDPAVTATRKAQARLEAAQAGAPAHNDRVALEARIRHLELELAQARARLEAPAPDDHKISAAANALEAARQRARDADRRADRTAEEAGFLKIEAAKAAEAARALTVTQTDRNNLENHLRKLAGEGYALAPDGSISLAIGPNYENGRIWKYFADDNGQLLCEETIITNS